MKLAKLSLWLCSFQLLATRALVTLLPSDRPNVLGVGSMIFSSKTSFESISVQESQTSAADVLVQVKSVEERVATDASRLPVQKIVALPRVQISVAVLSGTVLTFTLNNFWNFGPIKASSIVGLLAATFLPEKMALATFCGSFAGMARQPVIPGGGMLPSLALGACCAATEALFDRNKWLIGIGGRLGFMAQIACTTQFLVSSLFVTRRTGAKLFDYAAYPSVTNGVAQLLPICISTATGALLMSAWKEFFSAKLKQAEGDHIKSEIISKLSTSVAAVSGTGLVMSFFPVSVAGPAFCGSFVAMSSPQKIETYGGLLGASTMAGVSQLMMAGALLGGWGGKLGTASLIGVLLYRTMNAGIKALSRSTPAGVALSS